MSETKQMPTLGVMGVYTGYVLATGGFGLIHEVMDHFYPGIMTLGCAHMAGTARAEVLRQYPELAALPECTADNYEQIAKDALAKYGETMALVGPHGTGKPDMWDAAVAE